ncbi:MAG: alpha/beta hydrolase [Betaproteobacteria bacterium]|nr:alpha/beta hydrolase [Betaproteobacteria bacterium]
MATHLNTNAGIEHPGDGIQPAPSSSGFVEAGGLRLHYLDFGTAGRPAMLCVHGGAAHGHWFDFVASGFSANYHVRALDWRGHGDSAWADPPEYSYERFASDLAEVVEKLDLRDFVLVGHSMGGMAALVYAATYPGRVGKLVVVDTTMHMAPERISEMRDVGARQGSSYATREDFVARYRLRPLGTSAAPAIIRHIAVNAARQGDDGSWRHKFDRNIYAQRISVDGLPYWKRIAIPALLVKGDRSPRITPQIVAGVRARCPHVELVEVSNSDHHVTLDNPSGFVHSVNAFLARHG